MKLLSFIIAVMTALAAFGSDCTNSVNVHFLVGSHRYDPSLGDNRAALDAFISSVKEASAHGDLEGIVVYGYASPEGNAAANELLAKNRCTTIADYIRTHTGVSSELIDRRPSGIGWDELRRLVVSTPGVPSREKVLDILDNTPVWIYDSQNRIIGSRKKKLMDLDGGRPWNWMNRNLFPELRNAIGVSLYRRSEAIPTEGICTSDSIGIDSPVINDFESAEDIDLFETIESGSNSSNSNINKVDLQSDINIEEVQRLALKTNMLYYGILMPNLALEWLINDHWSVEVEGNLAWWGKYSKMRSYRMAVIDGEVRRWIKPRKPWHGMYAGVIAGGGWYDLEKGRPGKYGEGLMAGLTFGYMWPISRCLSLEAEIGAGYVYSRYKEYEYHEGHHVYMRTKALNYFGPIKLSFSLAWRFWNVNKTKRVKSAI